MIFFSLSRLCISLYSVKGRSEIFMNQFKSLIKAMGHAGHVTNSVPDY